MTNQMINAKHATMNARFFAAMERLTEGMATSLWTRFQNKVNHIGGLNDGRYVAVDGTLQFGSAAIHMQRWLLEVFFFDDSLLMT